LISSLEITAELESFLGAYAYELYEQILGMSQTKLIDFADSLAVILSYMKGVYKQVDSSDSILTLEEIDQILSQLEVEVNKNWGNKRV
jgi:hypothetical protein